MGRLVDLWRAFRAAARSRVLEIVHDRALPVPYRLRMIAARGGAFDKMAMAPPDRSWLYVPIPKAANSTIRDLLWRAAGVLPPAEDVGALHGERGPFLDLAALSDRELGDLLQAPGPFRFTFVRNPYARLASAWRNKIVPRSHFSEPYRVALGFAPDASPTFEAFVRRVVDQDDAAKDSHWLPQHRCAFTGLIAYDFVGRVETFERDMATVLQRIAAPPSLLEAARRLNPSDQETGEARYTDALAELAWRAYRKDFDLFGYGRHSWREPQA